MGRWPSALVCAAIFLAACSQLPRPSPGLVAIEKNAKARVSGVVLDSESGAPVPGIEVAGLPRGKDYPWEPPAVTDEQGRFTLILAAPAAYSFVLRYRGLSVLTPDPDDPGYVDVQTRPGERIDGVTLKFLRSRFESTR